MFPKLFASDINIIKKIPASIQIPLLPELILCLPHDSDGQGYSVERNILHLIHMKYFNLILNQKNIDK